MALITDRNKVRLDVPDEEGQWIEVRPLRSGDVFGSSTTDERALTFELLQHVIVAWSYEEPVTPEHVACLDLKTAKWLVERIGESSGLRSDDERKN
jgi:hypothetical protein